MGFVTQTMEELVSCEKEDLNKIMVYHKVISDLDFFYIALYSSEMNKAFAKVDEEAKKLGLVETFIGYDMTYKKMKIGNKDSL